MRVRGPNNVGRALQTDVTLLHYASAITEQKKCWKLLVQKLLSVVGSWCAKCETGQALCKRGQRCWELLRPFTRSLTSFKLCATTPNNMQQHATGCANRRNM